MKDLKNDGKRLGRTLKDGAGGTVPKGEGVDIGEDEGRGGDGGGGAVRADPQQGFIRQHRWG